MTSIAKRLRIRSGCILIGALFAAIGLNSAIAQDRSSLRSGQPTLDKLESLRIDNGQTVYRNALDVAQNKVSPTLHGASGKTQVVIRLKKPAVAELDAALAGGASSHKVNVLDQQNGFIARCSAMAPDMKVLARTQLVMNAVFVEVDAALLPELAKDRAVTRIAPVGHYEQDLTETVPYIGGTAVQADGIDGTGVHVAVLDSGIDYTHADLGGPGTLAAYDAAYADNTARDGLFPTAKVVDGFDFVGEVWPDGDLAPDDDPIDFDGHGSHVADIIGGTNGVAPGVGLVAVKVCSAVSSSCSGVALIQGMEFAVDPNGDGDPSDAVDIINMSLGATYGQPFDDDLSLAVNNATRFGVLTVSSAGNCGDLPYCTGTPSSAPTAISVAQTQVPSASLQLINVDSTSVPAVFQAWSTPLAGALSGPLQYGDGAGGNLDGCAPFAAGSLAGNVVLVDRGACNFTSKIFNIGNAGGVVGIIGLIAPGAPFSGGFADPGGPITIPGYMISQADSNAFKALTGSTATVDPANQLPLVGTTVGSTARGPDLSFNKIKPDIGAPGASVSAEVGTGTERTPFGGTSGASPMVAGSAALLLEDCANSHGHRRRARLPWSHWNKQGKHDSCSPLSMKARLMNNAERDIGSDTTGGLAEITRIGGGEVRVDWAVGTSVIAFSKDDKQPSLGLGHRDIDKMTTIPRKVTIQNRTKKGIRLLVKPTFRFEEDAATGAITVWTRRSVYVPPKGSRTFSVKFKIDPSKLSGNPMNSGSQGANAAALTAAEYDGYLVFEDRDSGKQVALPWQVMPRQAAKVRARMMKVQGGGFPETISLRNRGAGIAQNDAYTMIGLSNEMPRGPEGGQSPTPDLRAFGVTTIPVPPDFCAAEFIMAFAINTWDRQSHLVPVIHEVNLDIDQDGTFDYQVINGPLSILTAGNFSDPREVTAAFDLINGGGNFFFFAEHATNTNNTVLYVCGEQIGLSASDLLATNIDVQVNATDFYYGGPGDSIDGMTITPLGEGLFGVPSGDLAPGDSGSLNVFDFGLFPGNTKELGILLLTNGDRGAGARGGATEKTEALIFRAKGVKPPKALKSGK